MIRRAIALSFLLSLPAGAAFAQSPTPEGAKIVTEDLGRFWAAFDQAGPQFPAETFQKVYLDKGTPGLQDFVKLRIESAERLAKTVKAVPEYYASIRASTQRIPEMEPQIRAAFKALEEIYPEAVFPDVYFLVGVLSSGGTVSERGLLIGAEMFGRTPESPMDKLGDWLKTVLSPVENVPHIVAHELIHFQQGSPESTTLLSQAIREGSADFLSELISGRHINRHVHDFAVPRRSALWEEFKEKMGSQDFKGWLYSSTEGRPNDLGYWIGYEITKAYYDQAADKRQAVKEILNIKDFEAFLARSGYAKQFEKAKP